MNRGTGGERADAWCLVQRCTGWGYVAKWVRPQLLSSPCMILHCAGDSHEIESPGMDWFWIARPRMPGSPSILSCHCWLLIQTIACCWLVHYAASVYKEYHLIQRNCPNWRVRREYYEPVNVYYAIGGMKLITDGWVWLVGCFDANIFLHTTTFPIIVRMVYTNFTVRKFQVRFLKFLFLVWFWSPRYLTLSPVVFIFARVRPLPSPAQSSDKTP